MAIAKPSRYFKAQGQGMYFSKSTSTRTLTTMSFLFIGMLIVISSFIGSANAGSLHALANGKAIHLESASAGGKFNEENWGGGLQYDFDTWDKVWVPFVTVSGFLDSNSNPSYYAGGGMMRRFMLSEALNNLYVDVGAVAFLMTRKGFRNNAPFLGVLPAVSFGTEDVAISVTYIPKVEPKMVSLFFFQLKIKLLEF